MKHTIGNFYSKIVLRHLEWDRPDSSLDILEQFLEEAQQCHYKFRLKMLKKRQTVNLDAVRAKNSKLMEGPAAMATRPQSDDRSAQMEKARLIEEGRAFFCSELVIKAFKSVGLLH